MPPVSQPFRYMGIDPGKEGGVAVLYGTQAYLHRLSLSPQEMLTVLTRAAYGDGSLLGEADPSRVYCCFEKVGGYVGGPGQPGSHMFNFGKVTGWAEMAVVSLSVPYQEVRPQEWQAAFGMHRPKGTSQDEWKRMLKAKAQQLFPRLKVTAAVADALLIAEYCRRTVKRD